MGANGSYSKAYGGVPKGDRTHLDTNHKVDGHKVLLQSKKISQSKNVMWSNSKDPIYLIAKKNDDDTISIQSINVFKDHKLSIEIDLVFDLNGKLKGFNSIKPASGTHAHLWTNEDSSDDMNRKKGPKGEHLHLPVPKKFEPLLQKIEIFNNKSFKYGKKA